MEKKKRDVQKLSLSVSPTKTSSPFFPSLVSYSPTTLHQTSSTPQPPRLFCKSVSQQPGPMAEEPQAKIPALSEQYSLLKIEETKEENVETTPVPEVKAAVEEKSAEEVAVTAAAAPEGGAEVVPENTETEAAKEEANPAPEVEDSAATETEAAAEEGEAQEEQPEIKIETAPADFRFPTTNQTRHCFTRYIEYHRCVAAKGEDAPECDKFAKYYRSLCPSEWVERWNEQRENGTFPGPL